MRMFITREAAKELTGWVGEFCRESGKKFVFATSMDIDCFEHKYLFRNSGSLADIIKQAVSFNRNLEYRIKNLCGE
jgi:hypothetical protein